MALPLSGNPMSLNQIHVEAGGTTGTTVSINDADIRGLTAATGYTIPTGNQTEIQFGDFFGASASWSTTMTTGNFLGKFCIKSCSYWNGYGYVLRETYTYSNITYMRSTPINDLQWTSTATEGSLTDTTFDTLSNSKIIGLYWNPGLISDDALYFSIAGHHANSGFSTITIGSSTFNRSNATHTQDYQQDFPEGSTNYPYTYWKFANVSNPFGTTEGATRSVTIA